jgi:hypothetical protein
MQRLKPSMATKPRPVAYALNEVIAIYPITPATQWANGPTLVRSRKTLGHGAFSHRNAK